MRMLDNVDYLDAWPPLKSKDFAHPATLLGRRLLGCYLIHATYDGVTVGRIVETEAYLGVDDEAAHSYRGMTDRTKAMFGPAGHAYIYLSYGIHYCFNVVAGREGVGEGVLIRALEPVKGIDLMLQRRQTDKLSQVTNGPGKLVQAMGISKQLYGHNLTMPPLYISGGLVGEEQVATGARIGISKAVDLPLRYWIKDNQFVSK